MDDEGYLVNALFGHILKYSPALLLVPSPLRLRPASAEACRLMCQIVNLQLYENKLQGFYGKCEHKVSRFDGQHGIFYYF